MKPRTSSALAPTYTVEICTEAFSLSGYWRTLNECQALSPAMTINRLTTVASTGRRINRSVKLFISESS